MSKKYIRDFTKGNISGQLVAFAWPIFLANLLQVVYNLVDMIVVGKTLGKAGVSAVSVGGDITHLLTFIAMGFANAGQVIIAQYIGSGQREKISKFIGTMSSFLILCALSLSLIGLLLQNTLLKLMNTPLEAFDGASDYSFVCMAGLIFIYGYNVVSAILRGMGDSKHPLVFIGIASVINLVLDIILIAFLNMGAKGAAIATVSSQGISFIISLIFLIKNKSHYEIDVKLNEFIKWNKDMLSALLKLGIPMAIKSASIMVSKLFVNSFINSYGVAVSAFSGIASKIASVANLVSMAMNTAGSTMVGQNIAAKQFDRVKDIMKNIAYITLTISAVLSIVIYLYPEAVFGIFTTNNDADVLEIAKNYVPIAVLLFFGASARAIMNALINGSGHYRINFATAILDGIILRIGLALMFGLLFKMEYYGFWLGDALAGFTPFFIGVVFYINGSWKNPEGGVLAEK